MRTITKSELTKIICVVLILLTSTQSAFAYPPDNAAVLYYKASMLYEEPIEKTREMFYDVLEGKIKPGKSLKKYIESQHNIIDHAITASEIPNCDWGLDLSKGTSMQIPHLSAYRNLSRILIVDAKILATEGDYRTALSRCLTAHKMAAHAGDDVIISYLVGTAIAEMANECIQAILSEMPQDMQTLDWLKKELAKVEKRPLTLVKLKNSIKNDAKSAMVDMTRDRIDKALSLLLEPLVGLSADNPPRKQTSHPKQKTEQPDFNLEEVAVERIRAADEQFLEKNRAYWKNHIASVIVDLDLPYAEAYRKLKDLGDKPKKDAIENTDATLTAVFVPVCYKICHYEVKRNTFYNAIVTAVGIYIIKAETGRLPDVLPAGSPKDLFSDKDFEYKKTSDGFVLRCRAKDLDKDKIHEYEFEVKK